MSTFTVSIASTLTVSSICKTFAFIFCVLNRTEMQFFQVNYNVIFVSSAQKLLTNLAATPDEKTAIAEAKAAKPDIPLGVAEEFLHTLASIPELKARLSLWRFNYVFQQVEEVSVV